MILCVDMGNTSIALGLFEKSSLTKTFLMSTDYSKTKDEYVEVFSNFIRIRDVNVPLLEGIILSSVVPILTNRIKKALTEAFGVEVKVVGKGLKTGVMIKIDNPSELGADLVADAVGGIEKFGYPLVIADFGTASKLIVVNDKGAIEGVVLTPGLQVGYNALNEKAAQLLEISFEKPKYVIGKNTVNSMNSGAIYGSIEMTAGLTERIEKELGYPCKKVFTGGYSKFLIDLKEKGYTYDAFLVLYGLLKIYELNK